MFFSFFGHFILETLSSYEITKSKKKLYFTKNIRAFRKKNTYAIDITD